MTEQVVTLREDVANAAADAYRAMQYQRTYSAFEDPNDWIMAEI